MIPVAWVEAVRAHGGGAAEAGALGCQGQIFPVVPWPAKPLVRCVVADMPATQSQYCPSAPNPLQIKAGKNAGKTSIPSMAAR